MSDLWLIGAGYMGREYAKILKAKAVPFSVIGRGAETAAAFTEETGVAVRTGGVALAIDESGCPPSAILAVNIDCLRDEAIRLLEGGVKRLLIEKPAGLDLAEISAVARSAAKHGADVRVAFNRRFYAPVLRAEEMIRDDGGVTSFCFEFTEWAHRVADHPTPAAVKRNWLLANSVHVIDLAFWLGSQPTEIYAANKGSISWHPRAAVFVGAGQTVNGSLFTYHSNWNSAGRWGLEVCTEHRRLFFRPMEQLAAQTKGSIAIEPVEIDCPLDRTYKPGLYLLTESFLSGKADDRLPTIEAHEANVRTIYNVILPEDSAVVGQSRLMRS